MAVHSGSLFPKSSHNRLKQACIKLQTTTDHTVLQIMALPCQEGRNHKPNSCKKQRDVAQNLYRKNPDRKAGQRLMPTLN